MQPPDISSAVEALQRGDVETARGICQSAINAGRGTADVWHVLGIVDAQSGNGDAAIRAFSSSIEAEPNHVGSLTNLALLYRRAGRSDLAVPLYRRAIEVEGDKASADLHRALASALHALGEMQAALEAVDRSLRVSPGDVAAKRLRLNILVQDDRAPVPIDDIEELIAADPGEAANWFLAALAYGRCGRQQDSRLALEKCLEVQPRHHQAMNNLARLDFEAGHYDRARELYEAAIMIRPDYAEARFQLGQLLLLQGDYDRGWSEYAWRHRSNNYRRFGNRARTTLPYWDGSPLAGRHLVVYAEQGLGDTIQFLRYLPEIDAEGGRVTCVVQKALLNLLQGFDAGHAALLAFEDIAGERMNADVQSPLLSLPGVLWSRIGAADSTIPYLHPDPAQVSAWRERLGAQAQRPRVGLVWSGNPNHSNDANRSIPTATLANLIRNADVDWYSLHVGDAAAQANDPVLSGRVVDLSDEISDFASTAALSAALDLVISVDTAPAHVAGAVGADVWVLLPYVPDWRWGLDSNQTIWYPTMKLFRQRNRGDWNTTLDEVHAALRELPPSGVPIEGKR